MGPSKEIVPGKVVLVTKPEHINRLGIVLKVETSRQYGLIYKILILCEEDEAPKSETAPDKWLDAVSIKLTVNFRGYFYRYQMLGVSQGTRYSTEIGSSHTIINAYPADLWYIVDDVLLKVEPDKVIGDWQKRQNPRFK